MPKVGEIDGLLGVWMCCPHPLGRATETGGSSMGALEIPGQAGPPQSGQWGLKSAHPPHLEQEITLLQPPGAEARSWQGNMDNVRKGRHEVAGQEHKPTAKRASQGEVDKIDLKYI